MYHLYLGKTLVPIAPPKLGIQINNQNKTYVMVDGTEINVLKKAQLSDIDFELLLPQVKYPFAVYKDGFKRAKYFLNKIEQLKQNEKPFWFKLVRVLPNGKMLYNTNFKVSLEKYEILEDAREGFDVTVSIQLKQYQDYGTKKYNIKPDKKKKSDKDKTKSKLILSPSRPTDNSPAPEKSAKTHTVVKGDTLWGIAKRYYGDGSKWKIIHDTNKDKIKNPNLIYPGQEITVPVEGK